MVQQRRQRVAAVAAGGAALILAACFVPVTTAFSTLSTPSNPMTHDLLRLRASAIEEQTDAEVVVLEKAEVATLDTPTEADAPTTQKDPTNHFLEGLRDKMGSVDESRLLYPEYQTGEVTRMFSSLEYVRHDDNTLSSKHSTPSTVFGAAALIAGTTISAGILALPQATAASGFLPSSFAMTSAWVYMTASGLLVAELTMNRMAATGKPGLGMVELFEKGSLGKFGGAVGTASYFFLHYAIMVAYIAQGGKNMETILGWEQYGSIPFAAIVSLALFSASTSTVEKANNVMVFGVAATFLAILSIGAPSADFGALVDASNQHPEQVISCLPILFLALTYQNVVPTVVTNLEGDRTKITKAVVAGTTVPFLMFLAWNAVCLGIALGSGADLSQVDPVTLLQAGETGGAFLSPLVTSFSVLALVTGVIGFTYGLIDALTDKLNLPVKGQEYETWKPALFALVYVPPLVLCLLDPDIFYRALEYGGAFGVSTLFLVLPALMAWQERYRETEKPLMVEPMVPFGKLPLASMWKAAGTLIVEQGLEKLGVFDYIGENWEHWLQNFENIG